MFDSCKIMASEIIKIGESLKFELNLMAEN